MFRECDLIGLPVEMRLNRKSFQCEHFLMWLSIIVGVAEENTVDVWAFSTGPSWRQCFKTKSGQRTLLAGSVEGECLVPLRMQST